eukprot:gene21701-27752_t
MTAKSKLRSLLVPNSKAVCHACLQLLERSNVNHSLLSSVFSLYVSIESAENWVAHWLAVTDECSRALTLLDITSASKQKQVFAAQPLLPSLGASKLRGAAKALHVASVFEGLCAVLKEMLVHGCSTGAVALNLTIFVPMVTLLLSTAMDVSAADAVCRIESEQGVSPVDVCLVVSQLKLSILSVLKQLFDANHPTLLLVSSALFRPVASLLNRPEARRVPSLMEAAINCVRTAARAFPNTVADSLNNRGCSVLVDMLQAEMHALTALRSLVTGATGDEEEAGDKKAPKKNNVYSLVNSSSSSSAGSNGNQLAGALSPEVSRALFAACEALLTHCSATLSTALRHALEEAVGQGLVCLLKGILPPQYADRKVHRSQCEFLRQDPAAQGALLRLATVEVLVPSRTGSNSTNISVLRRVSESCVWHPETAADATRALLVIGALMHPVALTLPAFPAADVAKTYLANSHAASLSLSAPPSQEVEAQTVAAAEQHVSQQQEQTKRKFSEEVVEEVAPSTGKAKKSKKEAAPVVVRQEKIEPAPQFIKATVPAAATNSTNAVAVNDDDSDLDELPDLE